MSISDENRQWQPKTPRSEAMDPSPLSPSAEPWKAARANLTRQMGETADSDLSDWDDSDLAALRANAATLIAAVDGEQKRRKAAKTPTRPRSSARVKAKAEPDYEGMVAQMRALPVLPESDTAVRRALDPLTIPELKTLAGTAGVPLSSKMRKQDIRDAIHMQLIGSRISTDSVMHYDDPGRFDRRRAEAGMPASGGPLNVAAMRARLVGAKDADGVRAILREQNLTDAQARALAKDLGVKSAGRSNRDEAIEKIVGYFHPAASYTGSEGTSAKVTARPRKPRTQVDMAAVDQEITAMIADPKPEHRQRLREILAGMTVAQLQQVAGKHGTSGFLTGANKAEKANRLVENIVGFRLNALAIMGSKWTDHADSTRHTSGGDASARLRHAEAQLEEMRADLENLYGSDDPDRWPEARQDSQVEAYWDQRERVERLRVQAATPAAPTPNERAIAKAEAELETLKGRLGLAEDKRRRQKGGRIASQAESKLRTAISEKRRELTRLREGGGGGDVAPKGSRTPGAIRGDVMQAYAALSAEPGGLVSLVKLRDKLKHLDRAELDAVLKQMDRERIIQLSPDPNQKALPAAAREAAVMLGGSQQHFISARGGGGKA